MIAREQARLWGGPDAMTVGNMVCLDLIQGEELSLGRNMELLIGRDVYSGCGFAVDLKNKQTNTIMTACVSIKIMLESYGHRLGMLLFETEPVFKSIQKKSILRESVNTVLLSNLGSGLLLEPINSAMVGYVYMKKPEINDVRAEFSIYCGYDLNNPHNMRIYSIQRDTSYMRNKFIPQLYVPNELNLKRRVEMSLPSDDVVDMVKEQPYSKGSMIRPSTWHTPSSLVMGSDAIFVRSFDTRPAHSVQSDAQGFKEH
jgi:hypothetical protein